MWATRTGKYYFKKSSPTFSQKCQAVARLHELSLQEGWHYSIRALCRLYKLNRSWYYEWKARLAQTEKQENELKPVVETIVKEFAGYGVRRVTHELVRRGYKLGQRRVRRLLKQWGLEWRPLKKRKVATTVADPDAIGAENKLAPAKKQGQISKPNSAWVGDVVYIATKKETGFLATLLDGYSRKVVGWAVSQVNDTALTLAALNQAIASRKPAAGLIHHSDHGSNYTSQLYRERLAEVGAVVSHSRPGRPQENGMAESFNKTVSYEKLYLEEYLTLAEVKADLTNWLEKTYNQRRLHSSLGYRSPVEFEQIWQAQNQLVSGLV